MKSLQAICGALILCAVVSSCSYETRYKNRLRKAERRIEKLAIKYPQLLHKDTVRDTIGIIVPKAELDTAFVASNDTITVVNDRLMIRYVQRGDTVYLSGECAADTIYKTIEVPVERVVVRKQTFLEQAKAFVKLWWWLALLAIILYIAVRIGWKAIKPF